MKVFFVVMVSLLSLLGGCKNEASTSVVVGAVQKQAVPMTREERKAEAVAEVKKASEKNASSAIKVNLTPLSGYKLGDLYAEYLNLQKGAMVPASVDVSFEEVMSRLYTKKVNFEKCNKKTMTCKEASDTVLVQAPRLYKDYVMKDKKQMSFATFVSIADAKVAQAKKDIDWVKVCKHYQPKKDPHHLNQQKCTTLKGVVSKIAGKDMVAYGMTELLPSAQGRLNVAYMDVLLKSAGAEFLYHVPALGDELASLGFYQFTMYALRNDAEATEGASVINSFVKDGGTKIPDSVVYLDGHEHHTAAFYFAVHNLSRLVFSLSEKGLATFSKKHENYQDEMVMYIASSHHAPGAARTKTLRWVNTGMKTDIFSAYRGHRIHEYAVKTKANLIAVYKRPR